MKTKYLIPSIAILIIAIMGISVILNPSYEKSLKAKYYYEVGEYKEAMALAKEAFAQDLYNRMASTIMTQSAISLKYVSYNDEAKKYMSIINEIAKQQTISDADKAKIKMMCEIMTKSYVKLSPSVITDTDLVKTAAKYNDGFEKLLEKVTK
jgi:tetratricopeptide (TPR) repeat protein